MVGFWKGKHLTLETRMKLSKAHKGKRLSEKHKKNSADSRRKKIEYIVNSSGCHLCTSHKPHNNGYLRTNIYKKQLYLHRYIYEQNKGKIPPNMCVMHTCDVPICINPKHLIIGTNAENNQDKIRKNRQSKGEMSGGAKLSEKQVLEIFSSNKTQMELAKKYNISQSTISQIKRKVTWRCLGELR